MWTFDHCFIIKSEENTISEINIYLMFELKVAMLPT